MASVSLSVSQNQFNEAKKMLSSIPGGAEKAVARALNRALESAKTSMSKGVRERYTIPASKISESIKIIRANPQRLIATMLTTSARLAIPVFRISPKTPPSQKGIPVKLREKVTSEILSGVSKQWSHAFLARMRSGHLGIWKRQRGGNRILEAKSLSVPQMLGFNAILSEGLNIAQANLDKELARQIDLILGGG